jgi:hypothetical protein
MSSFAADDSQVSVPPVRRITDRWSGVALDLPDGWHTLSAAASGGLVVACPTDDPSIAVLIWPMEVSLPVSFDELARRVATTIAAGAPDFEAWTPPDRPENPGWSRELLLFSRTTPWGVAVRGALRIAVDRGGLALVTGFQAPAARLSELLPLLDRILGSFAPVEPLAREPYIDPAERAWSIVVPRGWHASGRTDRSRSPTGDPTIVWSVEDPATRARASQDGVVLPMVSPAMGMGGMMGMPGGGWNVQPYVDAESFCRTTLLALVRQERPDLQLERTTREPWLELRFKADLRPLEQRYGSQATVSVCLATSSYTEQGLRFRECAAITTWKVPIPPNPTMLFTGVAGMMGEHWFCNLGPTLRAPAELFDDLLPVLGGIALSFRADQAWDRNEAGRIMTRMAQEAAAAEATRARMIKETQDYVHRVDQEIQASHAATNAEINRGAYNLIAGKEDVADGAGYSWKVDSGYDTYWQKDGVFVGSKSTDLDTHLDAEGWQRLKIF